MVSNFLLILAYQNKRSMKLDQKLNRQIAKEQGFYDGRFRNRIVKDKKKEESRKSARKYRYTT